MPYEIKKFINGWYVIKSSTNKKMSIKPFKTKEQATKQMQAIGISESLKKKGKKY
jgi:hypothetical protein